MCAVILMVRWFPLRSLTIDNLPPHRSTALYYIFSQAGGTVHPASTVYSVSLGSPVLGFSPAKGGSAIWATLDPSWRTSSSRGVPPALSAAEIERNSKESSASLVRVLRFNGTNAVSLPCQGTGICVADSLSGSMYSSLFPRRTTQ